MTEEYARKAREQSRNYAVLSYRLPYAGNTGYSEEKDERKPLKTPEVEERYRMKTAYPQLQQSVETVSVTVIRHYVKLRKIVG